MELIGCENCWIEWNWSGVKIVELNATIYTIYDLIVQNITQWKLDWIDWIGVKIGLKKYWILMGWKLDWKIVEFDWI